MKRFIQLVFLVILATSCTENTDKRDTLTVSIQPQKYFVEAIAGNDFSINVMVPSGASPATYEPTPRQMVQLESSPLYFRIGHIGFEKAWMDNIRKNRPDMTIIDLSEGLELIESKSEKHGDHYHYGTDPHIWLSPKMVKKMSNKILEALLLLKPEKEAEYNRNHQQFVSKLDSIDRLITSVSEKSSNKSFLIFHPVLTYFARDYGFEQIPIEADGKEPGLSHLKKIADLAETKNIKKILIQKEFDSRNAEIIKEQISGSIIQIDPLSPEWDTNIMAIAKILSQ